MKGYRRDLETPEGRQRASEHGRRTARGFTDAQRRKGHETQRQQGRYGLGRFFPGAPAKDTHASR